jgi:CRP/FNR family cyclic AMP-dependent transcriptional regulator
MPVLFMDKPLAPATLLKSVSLFVDTPDEALNELVKSLVQVKASYGEVIFHKGDPGDSLYIIASGKVRVHDGERTLNDLGVLEFFGEMSILDPGPRSASVTALEETRLYRLGQDALYDLMSHRPEVLRAIIHILSQRLRERVRDMAEDFQYMQQFARVTAAAAAVEAGVYRPESLDEVAARDDQLGQLARVFQHMVRGVDSREQRLKREVAELRIEVDKSKQARQVAEITETDYFRNLREKASHLRAGRKDKIE